MLSVHEGLRGCMEWLWEGEWDGRLEEKGGIRGGEAAILPSLYAITCLP